jgi:NADPH:quinone reductase-like Zn-dependent oxidoreductase
VTGVCSTANIELVKSLGADQVIDYTKEDVTQNGQVYDAVFDAVGKLSSSQRDNLLKENGTFLTVQTTTKEESENLNTLKKLAEEDVIKAVIDQRFPLEQVPEAHRYVESGRKKGNVVITVVNQKES